MCVCAIEVVFPRTHGEVETEFPETVAGRILVEGIHLGHVVRIEQQITFDAQVIQGGETGGNDAERLAFGEDGVPDEAGVFALAEDLIAALAGVAGSRNRHRTAEQRRRHMMKIFEVANAGNVFGEKIDRHRALQRQIVQIIVDDHCGIAANHVLCQRLMARAAAVHHHPRVRSHAIQDAILDEMPGLVQHAGIGGLSRINLGDVAGGRIVQHGAGMRPDEMQLFQARDIHQTRFGADGHVILGHIFRIGPRRTHAIPILELGSECPMSIGQNRGTPAKCHKTLQSESMYQRHRPSAPVYSGALPGVVGVPSSKGASHSTAASR